jgi:energy-coupling factor transport system permease protein
VRQPGGEPDGSSAASTGPSWLPSGSEGTTAYHRLNPSTKLVSAVAMTALAVAAGGVVLPLAALGALVVLPAAVARVLGELARTSLLLSLPVAISVLVVNLFLYPGPAEVLVAIGPLRATREGLDLALEVLARVAAISGAVTLFYLTTRPAALVADLERRGVPARVTFVVSMSVAGVPAVIERAQRVMRAQRARGLDSEGSLRRRLGAVVPLAAPTLLGVLRDVDTRSVALEARGFTRPGRRTLLWAPADSARQRAVRWLLVAGLCAYLLGRMAGLVPRLA